MFVFPASLAVWAWSCDLVLSIRCSHSKLWIQSRDRETVPSGAAAARLEVAALIWCQVWVRIGTAGCGFGARLLFTWPVLWVISIVSWPWGLWAWFSLLPIPWNESDTLPASLLKLARVSFCCNQDPPLLGPSWLSFSLTSKAPAAQRISPSLQPASPGYNQSLFYASIISPLLYTQCPLSKL